MMTNIQDFVERAFVSLCQAKKYDYTEVHKFYVDVEKSLGESLDETVNLYFFPIREGSSRFTVQLDYTGEEDFSDWKNKVIENLTSRDRKSICETDWPRDNSETIYKYINSYELPNSESKIDLILQDRER